MLTLAVCAVVASVLAWYVKAPGPSGEACDPFDVASDAWVVWSRLTPEAAAAEFAAQGMEALGSVEALPLSSIWSKLEHESGPTLWHHEQPWNPLPEGWDQVAWRGGWLSSPDGATSFWDEGPSSMAAHWRDGGFLGQLKRTAFGWEGRGVGRVVWPDPATSQRLSSEAAVGELWVPEGGAAPTSWWVGAVGEVPSEWLMTGAGVLAVEADLRMAGIPVASRATRWATGGRWHVGDSAAWFAEVDRVATERGWGVCWVGEDVVVDVSGTCGEWVATGWRPAPRRHLARVDDATWLGTPSSQGAVAWHSEEGPLAEAGARRMAGHSNAVTPSHAGTENVAQGTTDGTPLVAGRLAEALLGRVRNHRTGTTMVVVPTDEGVGAFDTEGRRVWEVACNEVLGGAFEVDVYGNRKYQTAFLTPDAFHLVDVTGKEVAGFPLQPKSGVWTAASVVDYDQNGKFRFLLAASSSGTLLNFMGEGVPTPGWKHQPAADVDVSSPIRHVAHLRLGSRDYLYVGREDGQVELLRRTGATRAQTPVRVHAAQPPLFRRGASLDGTSVLFVDATGWVREFTLGQGEAVGLSGMARADRLAMEDVDGDGMDEVVTWLRGERTVWNARNEIVQ
jgi:hypothetical protein